MMKPPRSSYFIPIFMVFSVTLIAAPRIVQSRVAVFPHNGPVLIQAREEIGQNPGIVVRAKKSGRVLLTHTLTAEDDMLKPEATQSPIYNAFLRFQVLPAICFDTPLILAVAVAPGGSDHGFRVAVIGEVAGRMQVLTPSDVPLQVQGGLFAGRLNQRLGCGLVAWRFVWSDGSHYDQHPYEIEVYKWQGGRLAQQPKYETKCKYEKGTDALRELGIRALDQRRQVPKVKRYVE